MLASINNPIVCETRLLPAAPLIGISFSDSEAEAEGAWSASTEGADDREAVLYRIGVAGPVPPLHQGVRILSGCSQLQEEDGQ